MNVEYAPGAAWALVRGDRLLVLPAAITAAEALEAHEALANATPESVTNDSAAYGSPLAAVFIGEAVELLRRTGVPATVDGFELPRHGASTLTPDTVEGDRLEVGQVELLAADALPISEGIVRVSAVRVPVAVASEVPVETIAPAGVSAEEPMRESTPEPVAEPESSAFAPSGPIIDSVPGFRRVEPEAERAPMPEPAPAATAPAASAPSASAPVAPPAPSAPAVLGDHDGSTVRAEDARGLVERLRAQRAQEQGATASQPAAQADPNAVQVLSVVCRQGHVNPPMLTQCFVCSQPTVEGSLEQRPRPEFVLAQLPDGRRISLGTGAVFGRRPRSRAPQHEPQPHLIVVDSPNEDISRSHVELRIEEWSVVVEDLGSTNGTVLEREGQPPQRLRGSAPMFAYIGDRIDLGEGVVVEVVAP